MTKKLSLIACGLILSSSSAFAESTLEAAFAAGQASGDISLFGKKANGKGGEADSGYSAGTVGLSYETGSFNNFTGKVSFRAGHKFSEVETDDYKGDFTANSVMNEALIKYEIEEVSVALGRQEIDLEWIGDFNEAAVIETNAIPNTTLTAVYADRQAVAGTDELSNFEDKNEKGVYLIDAKIGGIEGLEINPYFYAMPDKADFYGLKASYSNDMFGIVAHYAATSEDKNLNGAAEDGDIAHIEVSGNIAMVSLAAGYITTDKKGGVGSIGEYGDNIDPTEEIGDYVYGTDADTYYGSIGTEVAGVELKVLYAKAEYDTNSEFKELSFFADYAITDELTAGLIFSDVDGNTESEDFTSGNITLTYAF